MSKLFVNEYGWTEKELENALKVILSNGFQMITEGVCRECEVLISTMSTKVDLMLFQISDLDVIVGMDWFENTNAIVDCIKNEITFWTPNPCTYIEFESGGAVELISALKVHHILDNGGDTYLPVVLNAKELSKLQDLEIVWEFSDVFPDELLPITNCFTCKKRFLNLIVAENATCIENSR